MLAYLQYKRLLGFSLGLTRARPTPIGIDNKSARDLALNPVHHQRSKHIDVKFHWIRDKIEDKTVELEKVDTTEQRADILTKALDGSSFNYHFDYLMCVLSIRKF